MEEATRIPLHIVVDFMTAEGLKELKCCLAIPVAVVYEYYQEEEHDPLYQPEEFRSAAGLYHSHFTGCFFNEGCDAQKNISLAKLL